MLTLEQIQVLIKERPRKKEIESGKWHQNRLKFHTETKLLKSELSPYAGDFMAWIACEKPALLPQDKIDRFKQLMTCPLPTIQLTQSIVINLSRVFEGQDAFFRYDFTDDKKEADWLKFRDDDFWRQDGWKAMINAIDSVWVVDIPSEQKGDYPEPKNRLIDISDVLDLFVKPNGECTYLIFSIGEKLFVYDEISIRVWDYKNGDIQGDPLTDFIHELNYCPARMFWSELLSSANWINRKAPLTNVLSELDWLLVHKIFKKYMDIANSFPILVKYETDNNSEDLSREEDKGLVNPQPAGKKFTGPGTELSVPIPIEGQPDLMSNPVKWITPDIASLEFHVTEDERLTDYIFKTSVGIDGEQNNDQAKNEKQVQASFENQSIILARIADNFEKIQMFAENTIIKLRYGIDSIENVSIDYGTKFFLKTITDLVTEKEAVTGDDIMVDAIREEMIETKFRNDTAGKTRAEVIRDLDPLPSIVGMNRAGDSPIDEAIKIYDAGGIDLNAFIVKCNLMNFVRRFEREQLPISQFMKVGDYSERVDLIKVEFAKYASEYQSSIASAMPTPVVTADKTVLTNPVKRKPVK